MTSWMSFKFNPRLATSVATKIESALSLYSLIALFLPLWSISPCNAKAGNHSAFKSAARSPVICFVCAKIRILSPRWWVRYFMSCENLCTWGVREKLCSTVSTTICVDVVILTISSPKCLVKILFNSSVTVAEKLITCLRFLSWSQIASTSSTNPISNILSASSNTKYWILSVLKTLFSKRSWILPGVPTITWAPWLIFSICRRILVPPLAIQVFNPIIPKLSL